jgi:hypothetical protein
MGTGATTDTRWPKRQPYPFTFSLQDDDGQPISDATMVTATLYAGRGSDPGTWPGTAVPEFKDQVLVPVTFPVPQPGCYSCEVGPFGEFDCLAGDHYVLVVDCWRGDTFLCHEEIAIQVVVNS